MDTTNNTEFQVEHPELVITSEAKYYLNTAARWATFIAVIAFIATGFIVLAALVMLVSGSAMSQMSQYGNGSPNIFSGLAAMGSGVMALIYLAMAAFYFFYAYFLLRFASSAKKAVLFSDQAEITKSFGNLKSFFKLWGIMTIVAIALVFLFIIIVVVFAASFASGMH
jgi:hypothetical protein